MKQITENIELYKPHTKGGRCSNGFELDRGNVVHLVIPLDENTSGSNFSKSLCGSIPGDRSYGWVESNKNVTCKKCISKSKKKSKIKDFGKFNLIKNELLRIVVLYFCAKYINDTLSEDSINSCVQKIKNVDSAHDCLFAGFLWAETKQGRSFWKEIYLRLKNDENTELTKEEIDSLKLAFFEIDNNIKLFYNL